MHEFEIINTYLKPLAKGFPFALGLADDAAILPCISKEEMVFSTDTLTAGIHFPKEATASQIARRSLRTSLSDLAAMGARPIGYLMNLLLPKGITDHWLQDFCDGLRIDQLEYHIHLLGGDLTRAPHDLSITMTVIGSCPQGQAFKRSTAKVGDTLYVTGTIGDAYLGLKIVQGCCPGLAQEHQQYLINRYYLPEPRFVKSQGAAAIDISDGLLQDLAHLCTESHKIASINQERIPLSKAAQAVLDSKEVTLMDLLIHGDDYELILAMSSEPKDQLLTRIGSIVDDTGTSQIPPYERIRLIDSSGQRIEFTRGGYEHEI